MKAIKVLGLSIISLLLFISLDIFGMALIVDRTVLNADFVSSEIERIDITDIVTDVMLRDSSDITPEMEQALTDTIAAFEPEFDAALSESIHDVYEYLRGNREQPELADVLRNSFLSQDFIEAVIDELDVSGIAHDIIEEQLESSITAYDEMEPYLLDTLVDFIDRHETWLKGELKQASGQLADYLLGLRPDLEVSISITPLLDDLKETLYELYLAHPPAELEGIPPALFRAEFSVWYDEAVADLPSAIEINEDFVGSDVPQQVTTSIADAETALGEASRYVGYFQTAFIVAIVVILLLTGIIVLICRAVKCSTRTLGSVFGIYGLITLVGVIISGSAVTRQVMPNLPDLPASIQDWLPTFINNLFTPLRWFSIIMLVLGVLLLVASFFYRTRQSDEQ
jgi:hypothetical protein